MRNCWGLLIGLMMALGLPGCQGMSMPSWDGPGPAPYQRRMAERFDPYPENDVGPAVVGGRPRDFDRPVAEPVRAGWVFQPSQRFPTGAVMQPQPIFIP